MGDLKSILSSTPYSEHFKELADSVVDYALFTMDREGIILNWNRGAESIKGYKSEEIVGKSFSMFYSDEDKRTNFPSKELEIASAHGHFNTQGWRYRKNGTRFWADVTISAIKSNDGEVQSFFKITRDLTDRMLAVDSLRQSEERFRLLIENVKEYAIFMLDPEGHVVTWNAGARRLKGYEESEILGKHFSLFYPNDVRSTHPLSLIRRAIKDGSAEGEGWRIRKDGSQFWGNVVLTSLYGADGGLRGFAKITRDLTERRKVEEMQVSDRQRKVFLATLAHELRNPLAPILVGVDLLTKSQENPSVIDEVVGMLNRQVGQISCLINDLLDASRVSMGKIALTKSEVSLSEIFESAVEAVTPAMKSANHKFVTHVPDGKIILEVDPHRIIQVITNLLSNAVKFTRPGGLIELGATLEPERKVRITISDNGEGVALDSQTAIFELFEQGNKVRQNGLGIGLNLVKTLTELHGGSVSMTSCGEGYGSEFHVVLPYLYIEVVQDTARTDIEISKKPFNRPSRVLVADDGKSTADIVAMFFRMEGMETVVAYDGAQAVILASEFRPQLVCLDIGMPVMDGYEAARQIRKLNPDVKIVALSGWGTPGDRSRSTGAAFDFHLVKPVSPDDLRTVLDRLVEAM
jgi:PAS domain S-box-containing protein